MFDLYICWKKDVDINSGENAVMRFSQKLKEIFYTLFFNNLKKKNSPALINKLFKDRIYAEVILRSSRKQISKLKEDKKMSRVESDFHYSKRIVCCKWQQQSCSTSSNRFTLLIKYHFQNKLFLFRLLGFFLS